MTTKTTISGKIHDRSIGFMGMLTILFIALKLTGYIDWSWWLVLLPAYGPFAIVMAFICLVLLLAALSPGAKK